MDRPWVTPQEVKDYTEYENVKSRDDKRLAVDITRAECWVIDYCNNSFDDAEKYPTLPEPVKLAVMLLAEAYGHNAAIQAAGVLTSETFDDYSWEGESTVIDISKLDVASLLDPYTVAQPLNGVTMRLRSL